MNPESELFPPEPPHGPFLRRISPGAIPVSLSSGYTMWHLLALGLLAPSQVRKLLQDSLDLPDDLLIDDLREAMTVIPFEEEFLFEHNQGRKTCKRFTVVRALTAWATPWEIGIRLKSPLLHGYWWRRSSTHPVVVAFHESQKRALADAR